MLRIEQLKMEPGASAEAVFQKLIKVLRLNAKEVRNWKIQKKSIDARNGVSEVYSVDFSVEEEEKLLRRCRKEHLSRVEESIPYAPPGRKTPGKNRIVVVGAGPAGLFATLVLAQAGLQPLLIERGKAVEDRQKDVATFWKTGALDPSSNVQFGEGGAGAFSDGKLNTGTKDPRHRFILETFVSCGAPETILYDAKPHIGTDYLAISLKNLRKKLLDLGAEIHFETQLVGIECEHQQLQSILVEERGIQRKISCDSLLLCLGHSARDTVEMLYASGVPMEPKPFAVGYRIEQRQEACDLAQYKEYAGHPGLPASTYKLSCHLENGRGVFSFCVCPGGTVVAAASEEGRVVTNGMSEYARDQENINGAILVGIDPEDYGGSAEDPLAGIRFQRELEEKAYALGGGKYQAPCQRVEDFLLNRPTTRAGTMNPSYTRGVTYGNVREVLPKALGDAIAQAIPILGRKLKGYDDPDALLTAVESRSSSPVKIPRNEQYETSIHGIYPCGEGAGYAGGILSAAADGMRAAEKVWQAQD